MARSPRVPDDATCDLAAAARQGAGFGGRWRTTVGAALVAAGALLIAGCAEEPVERVESRPAINTEMTVRVIAPDAHTAHVCVEAAWREMEQCALRLDRWTEASDIHKINTAAGRSHPNVDPITTSCLVAAKEVWQKTDGAFDPTIGPLLSLWREAEQRNRPPTEAELQAACRHVGMDKVEILVGTVQRGANGLPPAPPGAPPPTPEDLQQMVHLVGIREGMELDLGGIAKGYIAGRMARRMQQHGALAGLVAAGGDVYAFGRRPASQVPPGGDPRWGVAVQDPRFPDDRTKHYTAIRLEDQGVDTSGHYYRGYEIAGKRYSHIIDPRTGRPVDTRLASATVVAPDPALSDGLATAMAVLGVEKGLALVESLDGVECLLLAWNPAEGEPPRPDGAPPPTADLTAHRSSGFAAMEFGPSRLEREGPTPGAPETPPADGAPVPSPEADPGAG